MFINWLRTFHNYIAIVVKMSFFGTKQLLRKSRAIVVSSMLQGFSVFSVDSFWVQLLYFVIVSTVGYLSMKVLGLKNTRNPKDLDLFFTSVSAVTLSSMDTVEMEVFSNSQNIVLTILMFLGGEVFTSLIELQFQRSKLFRKTYVCNDIVPHDLIPESPNLAVTELELGLGNNNNNTPLANQIFEVSMQQRVKENNYLKYRSIKCLEKVVLTYFVVVQFLGSALIYLYVVLVSSATKILKRKSLNPLTFSIFLAVSTFANCGFVPTNENMIVFIKNSGLLWMLIPLILMGNTLYAVCLHLIIKVLEKFSDKKEEFGYLLRNSKEIGYGHLMSGMQTCYLAGTVLVFLLVQFLMFCTMEWKSEVWNGLNSNQKFVASLFQVSNTRHSGELVIDISLVSQAILILFVVTMYLPPYTSFVPINNKHNNVEEEGPLTPRQGTNRWNKLLEHLKISELSYLALFVILICVTERQSLKEDPINFSVLNIVVEVISAYSNVGFTTSYSCSRRINQERFCENKWIGFVGHWSTGGELILMVVMLVGRLKRFIRNGGTAWKLL